ncbi:MAG TPA: S41 family peptidase [Candidatus Obscuribacterales bacterium]
MFSSLRYLAPLLMTFILAAGPGDRRACGSTDALEAVTQRPEIPVVTLADRRAIELERQYEQVWKIINDNFVYRDRLSRWDAWRGCFNGRIRTRTELEHAIETMLGSLNDDFTYLRNASDTSNYRRRQSRTNVVEWRMLPGRVGYVRITTFGSRNVADESLSAFRHLKTARSYVVDLRDNDGGDIAQSSRVFGIFCQEGKFASFRAYASGRPYAEELLLQKDVWVSVKDGLPSESERDPWLAADKPVIVLVGQDTRSAAEMLAGALRDNGRAKLVGTRTFGKGLLQKVWPLDDNLSLKVSVGRCFLPSGICVQGVGLDPDYVVGSLPGRDCQLEEARRILVSTHLTEGR